MYSCAQCTVYACRSTEPKPLPPHCPMREEQKMKESFARYALEENNKFYVTSSEIEFLGYCQWVRVRETMELARRMGYHRLGLAFCAGLVEEARTLDTLLRRAGFEVESIICKTGGISKEKAGVPEEHKFNPHGHEPMCNPIAQAEFLNSQHTQFNIVLGLCVGHDSLFYKYSEAMVTTLVAKDRVLMHNPVAALYGADGYCAARLKME